MFDFSEWANEVDCATYDPDDNKIRIYSGRVEQELYDELKRLGFNRAYKQGCFYATWTPAREDAALALCSEIDDEDSSLFDRAEERSGRFATYSDNAEQRAEAAIKASDNAVAGIPFGQPILVGHHSERRHRKAVEKARREADKMVEEVDRRDYWAYRAKSVLRHASRTFDQGVVMRRIKKLEAEGRKRERELNGKDYDYALSWFVSDLAESGEYADELGKYGNWQHCASVSAAWAQHQRLEEMPKLEARLRQWQEGRERYCNRWLDHLEGQISYWKALLEDKHGIDIDEQYPLKKGVWIRCGYGWAQAERVNKGADGRINTVSIIPETASWYRGPGQWFYPRKIEYPKIKEWSETGPSADAVLEAQLERIGPPRKEPKPDPLREAAEAKAGAAKTVEVKVNWNPDYFPTPHDIVGIMLDEAAPWLGDGAKMLEPSAGDGRIMDAAIARFGGMAKFGIGVTPFWCEIDHAAVTVLEGKGYGGVRLGADFLDVEPDPIYDAVLMNPPFSRGKAAKHLKHAWGFVKPGGVLVAVQPGQPRDHDEWLDDKATRTIDLGSGAFKDAGTMVAAYILVVQKPAGNYEQGQLF